MGCSTMTHVQIVGTPGYAAPETFEGAAGIPSDVWGFGMVYLELCSGRRAWGNVSHYNELLQKLMLKVLPDFSHLSLQQQRVCRGCLNYDSKKRQSMEEILIIIRASLVQKH